MPRWSLAVAFAAGLLPGLLLYWNASRAAAPLPKPAAVAGGPAASPSPPPPSVVKPEEKKASAARRPGEAPRREPDPQLAAASQELAARLNAAEESLADLQGKLRDAESRFTAAQEQHQQTLQAQERQWRDQLQAAERQTAAAEAALKARDARLAEVEAAQNRLQRQGSETSQRLLRVNDLASELEEISRRRESYLNTIMARYREATDLFRAISLRLDNPRDASSPLNNDLSRIQAAIQHAEEDFRQLRALNTQSARLQKELSARR